MNNYETGSANQADVTRLNRFITKMFGVTAIAVLVSAVSAYLATHQFLPVIGQLLSTNPLFLYVLLFLPVILSFAISFNVSRSATVSMSLLLLLAASYGITLGFIVYAYTPASVTIAFVSSATIFVTMAIYGARTNDDLSTWGRYLFGGLMGIIVASLLNFFFKNPMLDYLISYAGVAIFTGLSAYDVNRFKQLYQQFGEKMNENSLVIQGALNLYLDFLNLFLYLLQIFGQSNSRNN